MILLRSIGIAMIIVGGLAMLLQATRWYALLDPRYQTIIAATVAFVMLVAMIYFVLTLDGKRNLK